MAMKVSKMSDLRHRPVAAGGGQRGEEAEIDAGGCVRVAQQLAHRQPEYREAVRHADAQMDGQRGRRYQPAIETRSGDGAFPGKEPGRPSCLRVKDICLRYPGHKQSSSMSGKGPDVGFRSLDVPDLRATRPKSHVTAVSMATLEPRHLAPAHRQAFSAAHHPVQAAWLAALQPVDRHAMPNPSARLSKIMPATMISITMSQQHRLSRP
jgi:hypothetical protein